MSTYIQQNKILTTMAPVKVIDNSLSVKIGRGLVGTDEVGFEAESSNHVREQPSDLLSQQLSGATKDGTAATLRVLSPKSGDAAILHTWKDWRRGQG